MNGMMRGYLCAAFSSAMLAVAAAAGEAEDKAPRITTIVPQEVLDEARKTGAAADTKAAANEPAPEAGKDGDGPKLGPDGLPVFPLQSEFFQYVVDSQSEADDQDCAMKLEFHALQDILLALKASPENHLHQSVTPGVDFREMMLRGEKHRGCVVQARGLLEHFERFPVGENKSGIDVMYRGQISNMMGQLHTFFSVEEPPADLLKKPVRITGVFMKRYAFKNRMAGEKLTWTPAVFVKAVQPYSEEEEAAAAGYKPLSGKNALMLVLFMVFLLYVLLRVGFVYGRRRSREPFARDKGEKAFAKPRFFGRKDS
jgi:hypothetical protein